jgi:hypothetical protein
MASLVRLDSLVKPAHAVQLVMREHVAQLVRLEAMEVTVLLVRLDSRVM